MVEAKHIRLSLVGVTQYDSHVFGIEGGTFGRSRKCDWPLPDSERVLSSVHGRILFENGTFVLVDESTNGIFLNGSAEPLGRGNAVALGDGVRLAAGPYTITARAVAAPHQPANHAPPSGKAHLSPSPAYGRAQGAENALHDGSGLDGLWGRNSQDPLDYLDGPSNAGSDNLLGIPVAIAGRPATPQAQIPAPVPRQPDAVSNPGNGMAKAARPSPSASRVASPIPEDFLAGLVAPALQPNHARAAAPQPLPSHIPEDFDPLTALNATGSRRRTEPQQPAVVPLAAAPAARIEPKPLSAELMADLVELDGPDQAQAAGEEANDNPLSDKLAALRSRHVQRKAVLRERGMAGSLPPSVPPMPPVHHDARPAFVGPTELAATNGVVAPIANAPTHGSVNALLEGLGFPEVEVADRDQERLLREIGETVREAASGMIALLAARRAVKTEFRMDETQVQPEENNPFKFFNVAELALDELFLTRSGGFQPAAEATRSAFEDIQQHSLLTMSAMQRAIKLLFERLSPETIEREHDEEGGTLRVRGLGARKEKWGSYVESHAKMNGNIDAIARQIVAEAFAQVHEEQARKNAKDHWEKKR